MLLFFHISVPLAQLCDDCSTGFHNPTSQMPNLPSQHEFVTLLLYGQAIAHRKMTFVILALLQMALYGEISLSVKMKHCLSQVR